MECESMNRRPVRLVPRPHRFLLMTICRSSRSNLAMLVQHGVTLKKAARTSQFDHRVKRAEKLRLREAGSRWPSKA